MEDMKRHRAKAEKGRIKLDVPTDLPDGAEVEVVIIQDDYLTPDELDPDERAEFYAGLDESIAEAERGETISAEECLRRLRDPIK